MPLPPHYHPHSKGDCWLAILFHIHFSVDYIKHIITHLLLVSTLMVQMVMSCHPILEMSVLRAPSTDSASRFILLPLCMSTLLVSCIPACVISLIGHFKAEFYMGLWYKNAAMINIESQLNFAETFSFQGGGIDPKDFAKRLWGDMYFNSKS